MDSGAARPLRLLVLRDWRPGHFHQAEGVAAAVARMSDVRIERLDARPRLFARNRVRKCALWSGGDPGWVLELLYGIRAADFAPPDIVIGSGRPTVAAGILIARQSGARFIYSGFVRDYDPAAFDLMLVRTPRQAIHPNCVPAPVASLVDPERLRERRLLGSPADLAGAEAALLLGGDGPGYRFGKTDWGRVGDLVADSHRRYGLRWRVANSRRTPRFASELFSTLAVEGAVQDFVDFRSAGPGSADALFSADAIVVTADSLTMMAEAMAARRPVVALAPAAVGRRAPAEELAALVDRGGLAVIPIASTGADRFVETLLQLRVPDQDPRDALAAAVAPVLGLGSPVSQGRYG